MRRGLFLAAWALACAAAAEVTVYNAPELVNAVSTSAAGSTIFLDGTFELIASLKLDKKLTLQGIGAATVTRSKTAKSNFSMFALETAAADVTLQGLTFQDLGPDVDLKGAAIYVGEMATLGMTDCKFLNAIGFSGGALYVLKGASVTAEGCTFKGNKAEFDSTGDNGGAVHIDQASFTATQCMFEGNTAKNNGGALHVEGAGATAKLTSCSFINNVATTGSGGAISTWESETVSVIDCTFTGNTAPEGGAIAVLSGKVKLSVSGSMFTSNVANDPTNRFGEGGAVYLQKGDASFSSCGFTTNTASRFGGAVGLLEMSSATFEECTFTANTAPIGGALSADDKHTSTAREFVCTRCRFIANIATLEGGALYLTSLVTFWSKFNFFESNMANGTACEAIAEQKSTSKPDPVVLCSDRSPSNSPRCTDEEANSMCPDLTLSPTNVKRLPATCGMCVRHRCSLWGENKCASRKGYTDPQGTQLNLCMCGCCQSSCGVKDNCNAYPPSSALSEPSSQQQQQQQQMGSAFSYTSSSVAASLSAMLLLVLGAVIGVHRALYV